MTALFTRCSDLIRDWSPPSEYLDYGLFIPGDTYRPLPAEEASSAGSSDFGDEGQDEGGQEQEQAAEIIVPKEELLLKFEEKSGGGGTVTANTAAQMARELGLAPSQQDIIDLNQETNGNITFDAMKKFLGKAAHPEDNPQHLIKFFQYYDTEGTGKLSQKQIKNLLLNFGEPLSADEISAMFKNFSLPDPVDYVELVTKLLNKE